VGIDDTQVDARRSRIGGPTVVRGVLFLPVLLAPDCSLLSPDGRKVMDIGPGPNDVRALAPGVYFVREEHQASGHKRQAIRKVLLVE
jgi:hypothetical protein